ncbi:hypothetical protein BV898_00908 [Hypsibius exemplaris]|uniref:BZIP domain-containing protein n=1 Tax=Hypsibius exemplaris TaxID=2072580 RepID=A0A1W0XCP0_HYPEX|nr:hypothetical protein BV898_00908 [Hypsibius exemplaris]
MALSVNGNLKPFPCDIDACKKSFVSVDKLNHHQHKEHGVPRKLSLNMGAVRSLKPPGLDSSDTPTPTRMMGDLDLITGLPKNDGMEIPMSGMTGLLNEYDLTPSIFDSDFKNSIGNIADKRSPRTGKLRGLSPRVSGIDRTLQPALGGAAFASVPSTSTGLASLSTMPRSPGAYFLTHITSNGTFVSSPVLPGSPMFAPMGGLQTLMPFAFPASPNIRQQSFPYGGPTVTVTAPSAPDPLQAQLQSLWASSTLDALRETLTPKSEGSSAEEKDSKKKKGKRKAEDLEDSISDSISITSEMSSTPARRARPILETDDPALADKRRRNRIAAEKCRIKRKDRQNGLEQENEGLKDKIRQLEKKTAELNRVSQEVVRNLQNENATLKTENQSYRRLIAMVPGSHDQQPSTAGFPVILKSDRDFKTERHAK